MIAGAHSRHRDILEMAAKDGTVAVDALARKFRVSPMTIRRDLASLTRAGLLARRHGGAVVSRAGVVEFSFQEAENRSAAEKKAIARVVAGMIKPGMTVVLDTGTTTLEVARLLPSVGLLRVLTTSLAAASAVHTDPAIDVILLGGSMRKNSPDLCGPLALENLEHFRVNLAVIGADAVAREGTFTEDPAIASMTQAMARIADRVVLAADGGKFGRSAFYRCLGLDAFDAVVTDWTCPTEVRRWLRQKAKSVIYAQSGKKMLE